MRNKTIFPAEAENHLPQERFRTLPVGSAGKAPKKTNTQPNPSAPKKPCF